MPCSVLARNAETVPINTPEPQTGNGEKTQTVGVQTIYRDSDAQTDPFTPEYVLKKGEDEPELLLLAEKTYGLTIPTPAFKRTCDNIS